MYQYYFNITTINQGDKIKTKQDKNKANRKKAKSDIAGNHSEEDV